MFDADTNPNEGYVPNSGMDSNTGVTGGASGGASGGFTGGASGGTATIAVPEASFTPTQMKSIADIVAEALRQTMSNYQPPGITGPNRIEEGSGEGGSPPRLGTGPANALRPDTPNNDFVQGIKGYMTIGGSRFDVEQVSVTSDIDTDDITNTSSVGGTILLDNLQKITGTITFIWDALNILFVAGMKPRTYAALVIKPDGISVISFTALISGFDFTTGPKAGSLRVQVKYASSGTITYPTANSGLTPVLTS